MPSNATWITGTMPATPLIWYQVPLLSPKPMSDLPSWQLDLASMGKGYVFVNGHILGRYWDIIATKSTCDATCDYRGSYGSGKCRYDCGLPTLRYYHVPRSWLLPVGQINSIIFFEEQGAKDVTQVKLMERN